MEWIFTPFFLKITQKNNLDKNTKSRLMIVGTHLTNMLIHSNMKNQQITCQNCHFFDASRHKNDPRTAHAGICLKWSQIELKSSTCKEATPVLELNPKLVFKEPPIDVSKLPSISQLSFL